MPAQRFRSRTIECEAMQLSATNGLEVSAWVISNAGHVAWLGTTIEPDGLGAGPIMSLGLDDDGETEVAEVGDWVVKRAEDGWVHVCKQDVFEVMYEPHGTPADPENPTA